MSEIVSLSKYIIWRKKKILNNQFPMKNMKLSFIPPILMQGGGELWHSSRRRRRRRSSTVKILCTDVSPSSIHNLIPHFKSKFIFYKLKFQIQISNPRPTVCNYIITKKFCPPTGGFFLAPAEGWRTLQADKWFCRTDRRINGRTDGQRV